LRSTAELLPWTLVLIVALAISATAGDATDAGQRLPDVAALKAGLSPTLSCRDAAVYAECGVPGGETVRYSLPAAAFWLGSAELPDSLTRQLDVYAEAMRGRGAAAGKVRIEAHTDASGSPEANRLLSQRRADAVKDYLVGRGVDAAMLQAVGMGSSAPKLAANPFAPENRRVEIVPL
jgi:outer membrane protein OmpA-like peptidoglycan-associated protein